MLLKERFIVVNHLISTEIKFWFLFVNCLWFICQRTEAYPVTKQINLDSKKDLPRIDMTTVN